MNITVFCSMQDVGERYTAAAREFATLIARGGHTLVWGGSNYGTMKVIADAAQEAGGRIVGVSVEPIKARARPNADEMIIAKDWPERRATLLARADAVAVLPGGLGTLDEITEVLEYKKQSMHDKPVVFINTDGFYDGLRMQFERMDQEGFFPRTLSEYLFFCGYGTGSNGLYRERNHYRRTVVTAQQYRYTILLEPAEEGGYVVTCPSLPGLVTEGDTLDEARAMAADAIRGYLESLAKAGLPIPPEDPEPLGALIAETIAVTIEPA